MSTSVSESATELGAWLKARARAEGFDDAEVLPASTPMVDDATRLRAAIAEGRLGPLEWMQTTLDQRVDIRVRLPWLMSVLVVVQSYYAGDRVSHGAQQHQAKVSRYAWGSDYHLVLRR